MARSQRLAKGRASANLKRMPFAPRLLPDRACLSLTGQDSVDFLDKLITQNVRDMEIGTLAYGALLSPQGKVSADFFIWRSVEGFILDVDRSRIDMLGARLQRFRLRARVEIQPREDLAVIAYDLAAPAGAHMAGTDPRLADLGGRALINQAHAPESADMGQLLRHRLENGLPDLAQDAGLDEVFALEGLLEELNGVSFKKGCFPGQENVSRMKRRATTRKKFCRLRLAGPGLVPGAPIMANDAELGTVRAVNDRTALALLRLDRAMEADGDLLAGGMTCHLDPPDWLILPRPQEDDEAFT